MRRWAGLRLPRRRVLMSAGLMAAALVAAVFVTASGAVSGSGFESADGNLVLNSGSEDWGTVSSLAKFTKQSDLVKSTSDDAFGQGAKEDNAATTVVQGSIPPNKSDLSEFYTFSEKSSGNTYLYLAWERTNVLGSANMDFEVNQVATTFPSSGGVTINRTAGDLLFTYDFGGSGTPQLGMLLWLTGATTPTPIGTYTTNTCYSANSFPCWGDRLDLTAAGLADGAINTVTVSDPILGTSLAGQTFGEMGVNLSAALPSIFGSNPTSCESLSSSFLTTRSSSSFTSEIKDFIRPSPTSVSNCGYVLVHKTAADSGSGQAGATFTITPGQTTSSGTDPGPANVPAVANHDGYYCIDNLLVSGSYTVTETAAPTGYDLPAQPTHSGLSATAGSCSGISYTSPPTATTSFVDPVAVGAIKITKTGKDKNCTGAGTSKTGADATCSAASTRLLGGAVFKLKDANGVTKYTLSATSSTTGTVCLDGIAPGAYTLNESTAPSGYAAAGDSQVTIAGDTSCAGSGSSGPLATSVVDQPLTTITVGTTPAVTGSTSSTVQCVNSSSSGGTDTGETSPVATSHTTTSLTPGTYTCTVVIDP